MIAIIPFEDVALYERIKQRCPFEINLLKGRIEIDLKETTTFDTSTLPPETEYFHVAYECGGGATKTGKAKIVCGENGEKLKPIKIYTEGHLANKTHAKFIEKHLVCVSSTKNGNILISELYSYKDNGIIEARTEEFWRGSNWDLPIVYSMFRLAVEAAHNKACCFHCREPHFILED